MVGRMERDERAAWIRTTGPDEWSDGLARLFDGARDPASGDVDNVLLVHSLAEDSLRAHLELYRVAMRPTPGLSKTDRELVALVVSGLNGCHY